MNEFILVWVVVSAFNGIQYSPPMKTLEDCKLVQVWVDKNSLARASCIQINILRKAQEK
jgi:hypothetical protein